MARSNGYAVTGNELRAMVNEHILLQKGSIPATDRCLTNAEVYDGAHVLLGNPPNGIPLENLGGGIFGASPNWLVNFTNINPVGSQAVQFEMNQVGNPYLNVDLFGYVNGSPLHLDPGSNLDGLFFGGPQYSPQMNQYVDVGNILAVQANFGRDNEESPGNWGWESGGYGVLEIYENWVLVSTQNTGWRQASNTANLSSLTYTLTVQPNVNYYIKAYSVYGIGNSINGCNLPSTFYVQPYPSDGQYYSEQDFYVGDGPAMVQTSNFAARRFIGPNTPTSGTSTLNGSVNPWWFGHMTIGSTDTVVACKGSEQYVTSSLPNLTPTSATNPSTSWTFIPAGENTIKVKLYGGSTDTVWQVGAYIGCAVTGVVTQLHWSPDTASNACDPNYVYHGEFFDAENVVYMIDGFSGYKSYLVTGGFQVGGKISVYPIGTNTITSGVAGAAYGTTGMKGYVYPDYASSAYAGNSSVIAQPIAPFVNAGYYSDGTNWARVEENYDVTTGANSGIIVEVGTCQISLNEFILGTTYQYDQRCNNYNEQNYYYTYDTSISSGTQLRDAFGDPLTVFANPGDYLYLKDAGSNVYYVNQLGIVDYIELCSSNPPAGTFLSSYCSGTSLVYRYANGGGGYYDNIVQFDSPSCGGGGGGLEEIQ